MKKNRGSVITGFFGALIGALLGAVVWAAVYVFGYVASLVGFLIGFLSGKGYDLMGGRQSAAKIVIVVLCVILAVAAGNVGAYAWILHGTYQDELAALSAEELQYVMSEAEFFDMAVKDLMADSEFLADAAKDLGVGLLFAFLGCAGTLKQAGGKKRKARKTEKIEAE